MWLMKTLLTSRCINQRGAGQKLGETPLRNKIKATLKEARPNSKICFIGDMQGELDGHITQALNLQEGMVKVSH